MEIRALKQPVERSDLSAQWIALDLEMANSFRNEAPVVCMVGLEYYDPQTKTFMSTIGSITRREEEETLIRWTLDFLAKFQNTQAEASLLTFAGVENDLRWLQDRVKRYGIDAEQAKPLCMPHTDLKREFYQVTYNEQISLKRLEGAFGIVRKQSVTSRQVSFLLTERISSKNKPRPIPEDIMGYLHQDVRSLLDIQAQWRVETLEAFRLGEIDYFNHVCVLTRLLRKAAASKRSGLNPDQLTQVVHMTQQLEEALERVVHQDGFEDFVLPSLPEVAGGYDWDRVVKRYKLLEQLPVGPDQPYRLRKQLHKPKGTLAMVRQGQRVLFIKRSRHVRAPGLWGLPGGELERGETLGQGAARELEEEVGLKGRPLHVLGASNSHSGHFALVWVEIDVKESAQFHLNPTEVAEVRWVSPHDLTTLQPLIGGALEGLQKVLGGPWYHKKNKYQSRSKNT